MIFLKTDDEIELLRQSNLLVGKTLAEVAKMIQPGVTTRQLDKVAEEFIRGDAELPDSLCDVGNPFVEEGIAAYAEYALYGIRADEASQTALVIDDAALPELVERLCRGVHVHL